MQTFAGPVLEGEKRGTKLGFPTANIALNDASLSGIYAGRVRIGEIACIAAIYADQKRKLLEAHLLDFSGDLYGKIITIDLLEKIRDDKRFENEVELKTAIVNDLTRIREFFKNKE